MKYTTAQLKLMARQSLSGNYLPVAAGAVMIAILNSALFAVFYVGLILMLLVTDFHAAIIAVVIVFFLVMLVIDILLGAGYVRICYQICIGGRADLTDLLYPLRNNPRRFLGVVIMEGLYSFLAMVPGLLLSMARYWVAPGAYGVSGTVLILLLTYIPAAVVRFNYTQAVMIMIESPDCGVFEALRRSRFLMQGYKWRLFVLMISFIGWLVLGYGSLGIGYLWISPYLICTRVFFYLLLKEEKNDRCGPDHYSSFEENRLD